MTFREHEYRLEGSGIHINHQLLNPPPVSMMVAPGAGHSLRHIGPVLIICQFQPLFGLRSRVQPVNLLEDVAGFAEPPKIIKTPCLDLERRGLFTREVVGLRRDWGRLPESSRLLRGPRLPGPP